MKRHSWSDGVIPQTTRCDTNTHSGVIKTPKSRKEEEKTVTAVAAIKGKTVLCSSGFCLLQGGGLGRVILLGAHVQSRDREEEGSGGRDRAASFSALPRRP